MQRGGPGVEPYEVSAGKARLPEQRGEAERRWAPARMDRRLDVVLHLGSNSYSSLTWSVIPSLSKRNFAAS